MQSTFVHIFYARRRGNLRNFSVHGGHEHTDEALFSEFGLSLVYYSTVYLGLLIGKNRRDETLGIHPRVPSDQHTKSPQGSHVSISR